MCDPIGRDCIEKNALKAFDCNTTCVGIYADIQFAKKDMKDKLTSMLLTRLLDLENEVKLLRGGVPQQIDEELLKRAVGEDTRELDEEKYNMLIAEYMKFKTKQVKHFRFNSAGNSNAFGKKTFLHHS